ncbi:HD domain-containing phosphohydrolase [Dissulfurimicrobium hydrothermale]|uniref:HD domain-containing phosphohydrolase n=1 Tax=Dissulfurimicrobium hydrothermale TaxID=1750598 RepID=UPI001EDC030A|nr:HD domain-containing phosphohydrolase [Dissulfurimicrobium hydrothermale]UKL14282.1 response regulator [Dissulfurimicrobium hydrothermale]
MADINFVTPKLAYAEKGPDRSEQFRIMVVDDEQAVREAIAQYFTGLDGFDVIDASNAFDALMLLHNLERVDCIISDINMPGMDGLEFIRRVKEKDRTIIAIVITGLPSMNLIIDAMRAGASDFIAKPFKFNQLQVIMERAMRERKILIENLFLTEELKAKKVIEEINSRLEKKIKEQSILFNISDNLSRVKSTHELYEKVATMACSLTETRQACFWVANHEARKLILMGAAGAYPAVWNEIALDGEDVCAKVARDGMPVMITGESFMHTQKSAANTAVGDRIIVPFTIRNEVFGVLSVAQSRSGKILGEEAIFLLHLLAERASLTVENLLLYESVALNLHATLKALVRSLEAKDPYTKEHSRRVTDLSLKLASHLGCTPVEMDSLRFAAHLHDIGKIGIMDQILLKKGRLTKEEYEIIKSHPLIGEEIVGHLGIMPVEKAIIRNHHERWDGNGYPDGLSGNDIPYLARILAVADSFDAITSDRPYRKAKTAAFGLAELKQNKGTQFDPLIIDAFEDFMNGGVECTGRVHDDDEDKR